MDWRGQRFESAESLLEALAKPIAYRGQAIASHSLWASLDRWLQDDWSYERCLAEETAIITKFCCLAFEFTDTIEQNYLQGPVPQDRVKALPILQHHWTPTRLLDWTRSPLVALYFAAAHEHDKDGAIWWFDEKAFRDQVGSRWDGYGMKPHPELNGEVNLNDTAFNVDGPAWISPLGLTVPFHRISVQQGFFTIAGRLRSNHSDLIGELLPDDKRGRYIVVKEQKASILRLLRQRGIDAKSLDYPGADHVGRQLTTELRAGFRKCAGPASPPTGPV